MFFLAWLRDIRGEHLTFEELLWTVEDDFLWKLRSHRGHTTTNALESFSRVGSPAERSVEGDGHAIGVVHEPMNEKRRVGILQGVASKV